MTLRHILSSMFSVAAIALSSGAGLTQDSAPVRRADSSGATVRLEAHEPQTQFKLGDPIVVDLVFTAESTGYAVLMDGNRFNAPQDEVNIAPTQGWFRSVGHRIGGSSQTLGTKPVRIPVVLNRSIVFQQPGHYEVRVTTGRLVAVPRPAECCGSAGENETTNPILVDILPRDEHEETLLVSQLSSNLEMKPEPFLSDKSQSESLLRELENLAKTPTADPQRSMEVIAKLQALESKEEARVTTQTEFRREAAIRLSYLQGDDAVRAKIRWLLADKEDGRAMIPA